MFLKLKVSYPPICENGEQGWASGDIAEFFLLSFDAHFFVFAGGESFKFSSYIGSFEPKFPAVFFCRNKGVRKYALSPEHIGRQRRPFKALWSFFYDVVLRKFLGLQWYFAQKSAWALELQGFALQS